VDKINQSHELIKLSADQSIKLALLNSWFALISLEVAEMDDLPALAVVTNQFSGQLIASTNFAKSYEQDVAWMDYLGRELLILNEFPTTTNDHSTLIQSRILQLQLTWARTKHTLQSRTGGAQLVAVIDPVISDLISHTPRARMVELARQELELVDEIESKLNID